jgi:4-amino-4-deoxy-L-arabinose transferase-like glycosyltransferase
MLKYSHLKSWIWLSTWTVLIIAALYLRPLLPVDETRYVSVAWEMWLTENFLVPQLNGTAYSHKPPLLFWIINLGWKIFGINEWWPRIIAPFFGLACLSLSSLICNRLWPRSQAYFIVPIILIGTFYWGIYTTLTMFDLIITFWTLVGINGLIDVWNGRKYRGWMLFTFAISLGVLTKGPVILVYLLPPALLAPCWIVNKENLNWLTWYLSVFASVCVAATIALTWAIPAGIAGGEEYQSAIFWGQSAGRIVKSFAHREPFWWYLAIMPILLMPWLLWPSLIRKLWLNIFNKREKKQKDQGLRLMIIWAMSTVVILSFISGKQPHYLLPMFPALAVAGAVFISNLTEKDFLPGHWDIFPCAVLLFLSGTVVLCAPEIGYFMNLSEWSAEINRWWGLPSIGFGAVMLIKPPEQGYRRILTISMVSPVLILTLFGILKPAMSKGYDLRPISVYLSKMQRQGYVIANYGKYHGQFHFLGKLEQPIIETGDETIKNWLSKTPRAKIIAIQKTIRAKPPKPDFMQKYRGKYILVWDRSTVIIYPNLPQRK